MLDEPVPDFNRRDLTSLGEPPQRWAARLRRMPKTFARALAQTANLPLAVWIAVASVSAILILYSQMLAWAGDEGFHLLASQLALSGKRPYLDFFYQHPPMFIYLNAVWMWVFGETWRSAHLFAALCAAGCVFLIARSVFDNAPQGLRRAQMALAAVLFVGLHRLVLRFGTVAFPYALCLLLTTGAFLLVVRGVARPGGRLPFWGGLCAGAALCSSFLAAATAVVLFAWLVLRNRAGSVATKAAMFIAGGAVGLLPLFAPFAQAPRVVFFDLVEYHLFHRSCTGHHLRAWVGSLLSYGETRVLLVLAALGIWFLTRVRRDAAHKEAFYLCACLVAGNSLYLLFVHNLFEFYFSVLIPFLGVCACLSLDALASDTRVRWIGVALSALAMCAAWVWLPPSGLIGLRSLKAGSAWQRLERICGQLQRVLPKEGDLYASEDVYFLMRRVPPPGMENSFGRDVKMGAARAKSLRLVSEDEVKQWLKEGRFAAVLMDPESDGFSELGLARNYSRSNTIYSNPGGGYAVQVWIKREAR